MAAYKNKEELMNTNWQQKINDAKAAGDMKAAAEYEQARNDKINSKDYTGSQTTTNNYSQYLNSGSSGSVSSNDGLNFRGIDYTQTDGGIYGVPVINSDVKNYKQGGVTYQVGANMARRPDLAGKIAISNGYTVFYDDNGYATKAIKGVADYTPHQDINAGNGTYNSAGAWTDNEMLTQNDKDAIEGYRKLAREGKMSWSDANAKANAIRSGYGYTIDNKGNVTDLLAKSNVDARRQQWGLDTSSPSDAQQNFVDLWEMINNNSMNSSNVQYDPAPQWNGSDWDSVLESLANQLLNMNYTDWTKGDQYQALADRYGQQGKLSMQDVLGQISSRTGGLASSYATTAAQQQYNSFMSQLEDAAMEMYGVEMDDLYNRANMARQYAQDDYNKYLDEWNQWNTNRNFNYGAYRDSVADKQWQQSFDYNKYRDDVEDSQWEQTFGYNQYRDSIADQQWQQQFDYNMSKKNSSPSGSNKPTLTAAQALKALEDGIVNDTTKAAYEYYYGQPWDDGSETEKKSYTNNSGVTATPLDYETIKKNSEAGNYGSKYGLVLGEIQAKFAKGADAGTLADIIDKALKNGDINEAGADTLFRALGY